MTKNELNAQLKTPLSASKLKKTKIADLRAMVDGKKRKTRELPDHVFCEPAKTADVKPIRAGTKRAALIDLLAKGATMDEMVEALGWKKDVVSSAFRVDVGSMGYGVERKAGKYHLILPKKFKRPAIREAGMAADKVLVDACR